MRWLAYIQQTGTLNVGLRVERGFAMLAAVLSTIHGGKAEMSDFLPDREIKQDGEPAAATVDDIMRLLQSSIKG